MNHLKADGRERQGRKRLCIPSPNTQRWYFIWQFIQGSFIEAVGTEDVLNKITMYVFTNFTLKQVKLATFYIISIYLFIFSPFQISYISVIIKIEKFPFSDGLWMSVLAICKCLPTHCTSTSGVRNYTLISIAYKRFSRSETQM